MRCQIPTEVTSELNQHIEDVLIPNNVDHSKGLVGQIRQHERSAQLTFPHEGDEAGVPLWREYRGAIPSRHVGRRLLGARGAGQGLGEEGQEGPGDAREGLDADRGHPEFYITTARVDGGRDIVGPVRVLHSSDAARRGESPGVVRQKTAAAPGPRDGHLPRPRGALRAVLRRGHPPSHDQLRRARVTAAVSYTHLRAHET